VPPSPTPATARSRGFLFESDAIGLVRGFDDDRRGWHAAVANLDYRFPLWRLERGMGTLPAFVRTVHGALFVDAGHAWNASFRARDARTSLGVELSVDTILGYALPLTFTGGAAWRHDGLTNRTSAVMFGRVGRAF
jgi:outer membrane protein assembly factor BamA